LEVNAITPEIADNFAQQLRGNDLAVDTHNRKIRRVKKIFEVLKEYRSNENPFNAKSLRRKERENRNILSGECHLHMNRKPNSWKYLKITFISTPAFHIP